MSTAATASLVQIGEQRCETRVAGILGRCRRGDARRERRHAMRWRRRCAELVRFGEHCAVAQLVQQIVTARAEERLARVTHPARLQLLATIAEQRVATNGMRVARQRFFGFRSLNTSYRKLTTENKINNSIF